MATTAEQGSGSSSVVEHKHHAILSNHEYIVDGDVVVLYTSYDDATTIVIQRGKSYSNRWGTYSHANFIGARFGTKVLADKGKGWLVVLRPTPELWTLSLSHRTQILYIADISLVMLYLDLKPGSIVLESGTGSGSLTTSMARAVAPTGKVYTFEFHPQRAKDAATDFARNGVGEIVHVTHRDICGEGFIMFNVADAVFLDLPAPWLVVQSATDALKEGGVFCSFSPCAEQVLKTCEALRERHYVGITTVECLLRPYDVRTLSAKSPAAIDKFIETCANEGTGIEKDFGALPDVHSGPSHHDDGGDSKRKRARTVAGAHGEDEASGSFGTVKPAAGMRGHTGYLTFARRPCVHTPQQPQPKA